MVNCIIISFLPTKPIYTYVYCSVTKVHMAVAASWNEFRFLSKVHLPFV